MSRLRDFRININKKLHELRQTAGEILLDVRDDVQNGALKPILNFAIQSLHPRERRLGWRIRRLSLNEVEMVVPEQDGRTEADLFALSQHCLQALLLRWQPHVNFKYLQLSLTKEQIPSGAWHLRLGWDEVTREALRARLLNGGPVDEDFVVTVMNEDQQQVAQLQLRIQIEWPLILGETSA